VGGIERPHLRDSTHSIENTFYGRRTHSRWRKHSIERDLIVASIYIYIYYIENTIYRERPHRRHYICIYIIYIHTYIYIYIYNRERERDGEHMPWRETSSPLLS